MKDETIYFLGEMLEQLFERTIEYKEDLERRESELDEGILSGYYIVIGKLFNEAKLMGLFAALPSPWKGATPESLMSDIKQGKYTFGHISSLGDAFIQTSEKLVHRPLNLRRVLEEIIAESDALKKNLKSEFDVGIRCGYYFSFNKLFNYADVWGLLTTFPAELQNFVPKSINHKHASMRTLQVVCTRQDLILQANSEAAGYWIVI